MKVWQDSKKTIGLILSVGVLFTVASGLPAVCSAQSRPDVPTANLEVPNAVPLDLVKKIALEKSKETWGPGTIGELVALSDFNGDVVAYMVPFHMGEGNYPTYDEVLKNIQEGRELRDLARSSDREKAKKKYMKMDHGKAAHSRAVVASDAQLPLLPPMDPMRSDGSISRQKEMEEIRKMEKFASDRASGADHFGTIIVSATYDRVPVVAYLHYLAPYFANFDLALANAEQAVGPGASLKRIYFEGFKGQYFEFKGNRGSVLMHHKSLERENLETLRKTESIQALPQPETALSLERKEKRKSDMSKMWKDIESEVGGL